MVDHKVEADCNLEAADVKVVRRSVVHNWGDS